MKRKIAGIAALVLAVSPLAGQPRHSFAIITDSESFRHCGKEIEHYRESIIRDGLDAFIAPGDWNTPEQVRDSLRHWYRTRQLEGTVFIGDIPIPMIQKAQHLTSAFKMDEERFPRREASVPSDRFYDDFDLEFRFVGRDTAQADLFYYDLSPFSPQSISCDIYSARIKPSSIHQDRYAELAAYLRKLVRIKAQENLLDEISSHTGDGSFSNSLIAWKDETITLAEQFPDASNGKKEPKFFLYAMHPDIKDLLLEEIRRPDLDLILFHEHGLTDQQYVTGLPVAIGADACFELGRYHARSYVRNMLRFGHTLEEAYRSLQERYPDLRPEWYTDALDPAMVQKDSLLDSRTVIGLGEIQKTAPNMKMAIFDACYNGDFREEDWIANRYIMAGGDCIVTIGNSVNVLQDKSSSDLMGMLSAGYRIGQWMQLTNLLESHIFGDPTFHFKSSYSEEKPDFYNEDCSYWLDLLQKKENCYTGSLALHQLFRLDYEGLSSLLLETYRTSPYYMERLQCLHLLAHYNDGNYRSLLKEAADDPYEFIRRKALYFMGKDGSPELTEDLAEAYLRDFNSKRICFNIGFAAGHFPEGSFHEALKKAVAESPMVSDKAAFLESAETYCTNPLSMAVSTARILNDPETSTSRKDLYLMGMRNNPYPFLAERLIGIVLDEAEDTDFRTDAAHVLGWFVRSYNRTDIIRQLGLTLEQAEDLPEALKEEITKTIRCLETYCR